MNADEFQDSPAGYLVPTIANCMAFVPNPLPPPKLDMARLIGPLEQATRLLGELSGVGRTLPNPELLVRPFSRAEAVASSRIEGTVSPAFELLMLERSPDIQQARDDTREVNNYNRALRYGLDRIKHLPLTKRLFCELHAKLLEGVSIDRGAHIAPGELKREQNWIGARTIQNARFVPPPPSQTLDALDGLEKFIHGDDALPLLVRMALIHYQFETIHPFPDGNGRVGRLIIPLMLCERRAMSQPLLYLSTFFEKHYDQYIDAMLEVSRTGAWDDWIVFFLKGVEAASASAIRKAHAIQDLHQKYMNKIRSTRSSALLAKIVDSLFAIPALNTPIVARDLGVSYNAAKGLIGRLVALAILAPGIQFQRSQWFFATEIRELADKLDP